uniref:G-protein coupled receptors family 1 profile domain-containing protein n=1 Tax=Ficedula albicollis TaxID=59894 RepID=U3JFJ1_FICAL
GSSCCSSISHFLLLPLADTRQLQLLHFCLFLGISLAALLGNGLIISAVACGQHLHTPMFLFLLNLALSDLGCICTTVPKALPEPTAAALGPWLPAEDPLSAGTAQSLFHLPPSPGCGLSVPQYWHIC